MIHEGASPDEHLVLYSIRLYEFDKVVDLVGGEPDFKVVFRVLPFDIIGDVWLFSTGSIGPIATFSAWWFLVRENCC